jgi:hypothetical protein
MMRIEGRTAWADTLKNKSHRWTSDLDRFRANFFSLDHRAKFTLASDSRFFCIGSCFARNIEEHLIYRGMEVLSKHVVCPKEESPIRPNGFLNKFTTPSMANELEWVVAPAEAADVLVETEKGWIDTQLAPGIPPVSLERARKRRRFITDDYFPRIKDADVVVITFGLIEAWFDTTAGIYWNSAPSLWEIRRNPGRFFFESTDYETNQRYLNRVYDLLQDINPKARIVVTVSPVPLTATFTGRDIAAANTYSKSVLRAVAQAFADRHENVDYFPSFELVMLSRREAAFSAHDFAHVKDALVGQIIECFISSYIGEMPRQYPEFIELMYLAANPDVDAAVRRGELVSGYHHWLANGRDEGRPIVPQVAPEWALMAGMSDPAATSAPSQQAIGWLRKLVIENFSSWSLSGRSGAASSKKARAG